MFKNLFLLIVFLLVNFHVTLFGQTLNFKHNLLLKNITDESQLVISIKNNEEVNAYLQSNELRIKSSTKNWNFLTINGSQLKNILNSKISNYLYIETSEPTMNNDTSRVHHKVDAVQKGINGLQTKYKGKGVLLGFIDNGMEYTHLDFYDSLGKTRLYSYWDQTNTNATLRSPKPFNYGDEWTSSDLDSKIFTPTLTDGHGTHVPGIATGNGRANGRNLGMAPEATIVYVQTYTKAKNWTLTVSDACDYIFKIADQLNMPCVINISYGVANGSHDGSDPASEFIESMLDAKPGRIVVAAAGNSGNLTKYHVGNNVTSDTSFFWLKNNVDGLAGKNTIWFESWADSLDFANIKFSVAANLPGGNYQLRSKTKFITFQDALANPYMDTLYNENGVKIGRVEYYGSMVNHMANMELAIYVDSINYLYQFRTTGQGRLDCWSLGTSAKNNEIVTAIPSASVYPDIVHYILPDSFQTLYSSYIASEKVITVGNISTKSSYITKDLVSHPSLFLPSQINISSSMGPNRKGVIKPDIVASGTKIFSASPLKNLNDPNNISLLDIGGYHILNSGTSMASPLVAGIAALYLEKCSKASYLDFKNDMISTAKTLAIQGSLPNNTYGNGEIDALALLLKTNAKTSVSGISQIICDSPAAISINSDRGISSIVWDDKTTNTSKTFKNPGKYGFQISDSKNCVFKDTVFITGNKPINSTINFIGNSKITCTNKMVTVKISGGTSYQWSGGNAVQNDTNSFDNAGKYYVLITTNGCSKKDSILIENDTIHPTLQLKLLTPSKITCSNKTVKILVSGATDYVWDNGFSPMKDTNEFNNSGTFHVVGSAINGCTSKDSIKIFMDTLKPKAKFSYIGLNKLTCSQKTVTIVASGGQTYKWFSGDTPSKDTNSFENPGVYSLQLTGSNSCVLDSNITILQDTVSPSLSIIAPTGNSLNCTKLKTTLFVSGANNYLWTGGLQNNLDSNVYISAGKYFVTGTNLNGCSSSKSFQIYSDTSKPNVVLKFIGDSSLTCINKSVRISMIGAKNYFWNGGQLFSNNIQEFTKEGSYELKSIGNNTCESKQTITLIKDTILPVITKTIVGNNLFTCLNKSIQVVLKGADKFLWDSGNSPNGAINTFTQPGVYHYIANNSNGCLLNDSITLETDTIPAKTSVQTIGKKDLTCSNNRVFIKISGGVNYSWNGGNSTKTDTNSFTLPGNYLVNITDDKGCKSSQNIYISQNIIQPKITINLLTSPYITCDNEPVKVKVVGAATYTWDGGLNIYSDTNTFLSPGVYNLIAKGENGCLTKDAIIVDRHSYPLIPTITQKDSLLTASASPNYQWYEDGNLLKNETKQSIVYKFDKTYFVSVESNGCISSSKFYSPSLSSLSVLSMTDVYAFPNPTTTGKFSLQGVQEDDELNVYDLLGNKISLLQLGQHEYQLESLADGVYYLAIVRKSSRLLLKIVKN